MSKSEPCLSILVAEASDGSDTLSLCRTMACFESDLHSLISGGDHVVLALCRSYL